ncbi:CopD family protein [Pseudotabrizicola formosa]|uniref:CopD family protein n=1 Tax=Pseudotabrizicola formosa TaxID=2030009 RepID=UPI000CD2A382|nr:CopD family protein [Pseudotabrizicola formosa]
MIAVVKFVHIAALLCWSAALVSLPVLLHHYRRAKTQSDFTEYRLITHYGYIAFASPAAIVAIVAGTLLIFLAEVYDPWLLVKLAFVAGMVLVHAWLGHLILRSGETGGRYKMPPPLIGLPLVLTQIAVILWLVLAKPDLAWLANLLPAVALEPQGGSL